MNRADLHVRARSLTGFMALLQQGGGDGAALLARHGLTAEQLEDENHSLPLQVFGALTAEAAALLQQPDFGLRLAARQNLSVLGPVALVMQHARSVGEALELLARYMPYHSPGLTLRVQVQGEEAVIQMIYDASLQGEARRQLTEHAFGVGTACMRMLARSPGDDWRIEFQHDSPLSLDYYRERYGCAVQLGQAADRLLLPAALLQVPIDLADSGLQEAAERSARHLMQRYPLDLGRQVSGLVERDLASGSCTLPHVARQMHMPEHALKRRLAALGLHFEDIVDQLRRERATRLLPHAHIPLTEVAFLLGYGDPSSLTRACRRWFGKTPKELRKAAQPDARMSMN